MKLLKKLGSRLNKTGNSYSSWGLFLCDYCNKEVEKMLGHGKKSKSCGCMKDKFVAEANTKHGGRKKGENERLYKVWWHMIERCYNKKDKDYKNYGKRGINVCREWLEYIPFRDWALLNGYDDNLTIDRENNDGNYEPSNCRFITYKENNRNRSYNILNLEKAEKIREEYKTGKYTQRNLANKYGVTKASISYVVNNIQWA